MKQRQKYLNKLAREAVKANQRKEPNYNILPGSILLMRVIMNLSKAVVAHEKLKPAHLGKFKFDCDLMKKCSVDEETTKQLIQSSFERYIKRSFEDALASAMIELLSLSKLNDNDVNSYDFFTYSVCKYAPFHSNIFSIIGCLFSKAYSTDLNVINAINNIVKLTKYLNIDILEHVKLRLKYNELREYKYGKNKKQ